MDRCEDYPCCGHTDGLPCNWTPPTEYPHAGCDHEAGYCQVAEDDEDDEMSADEYEALLLEENGDD